MIKVVILIGGPQKGTRFRPLSLEVPKPLFPVAGFPMIYHHIEACTQVPNLKEILITGFYQPSEALNEFLTQSQMEFKIPIRYLQEFTSLGTAGGIYHFRDQILSGGPEYFFVMNADVCCDFPLSEMLNWHIQRKDKANVFTLLGTESTTEQSLNYGCIVEDPQTHEVHHYVEKPETFISSIINCGIYLFTPAIFEHIGKVFQRHQEESLSKLDSDHLSFNPFNTTERENIRLEQDIFVNLADTGKLFVFNTTKFWSQIKTVGAAIYANRQYLAIYHRTHPERLAKISPAGPKIIGDVFIHETAKVDPSATIGPNVTIGKNAVIGAGVRIRESLVMGGAVIQDHSLIIYSIIGWKTKIGMWSRVEGTPDDPNPNKPFAKLDNKDLFNDAGKLNPSITVIGSEVHIPPEVIVLNSIVLPHKDLSGSFKNRIIL